MNIQKKAYLIVALFLCLAFCLWISVFSPFEVTTKPISQSKLERFVLTYDDQLNTICEYVFENPNDVLSVGKGSDNQNVTDPDVIDALNQLVNGKLNITEVYFQAQPVSVHFLLPTYYPNKDLDGATVQITQELIYCEDTISSETNLLFRNHVSSLEEWQPLSVPDWYNGFF